MKAQNVKQSAHELWWSLTTRPYVQNPLRALGKRLFAPPIRESVHAMLCKHVIRIGGMWVLVCPYTGENAREQFADDLTEFIGENAFTRRGHSGDEFL